MDEELREELEVFKFNLQIIFDKVDDVHQLILELNKVCKNHKLRKVKHLSEKIEKEFSVVFEKFNYLMNQNNKSATIEDILKNIKFAIENKKVKAVD